MSFNGFERSLRPFMPSLKGHVCAVLFTKLTDRQAYHSKI
nr:MAG TPA: hypothetical protein [Caudoviricetes sp.]